MTHTWQDCRAQVTGYGVAVYRYMERGEAIGTLDSGQTVPVRLGGTGWYQVRLADGVIGYVCKADAVMVSAEAAGVG